MYAEGTVNCLSGFACYRQGRRQRQVTRTKLERQLRSIASTALRISRHGEIDESKPRWARRTKIALSPHSARWTSATSSGRTLLLRRERQKVI